MTFGSGCLNVTAAPKETFRVIVSVLWIRVMKKFQAKPELWAVLPTFVFPTAAYQLFILSEVRFKSLRKSVN